MNEKKPAIFALIIIAVVITLCGFLFSKIGGTFSKETTGKMIVWDWEGKPVEIGGCRDSDGDSMYISGQCTDKTRTQSDGCIGNKLVEQYCGKSGNMITGRPIVVWDFGQPRTKPQPEYICYTKTYDCSKVKDMYGSYRCVSGKCAR